MARTWIGGRLAAASVTALVLGGCGSEIGEWETSSKPVTFEELPAVTGETIRREAGDRRIRELEEKVVNGRTVYEASWIEGGAEVELVVSPSGEVLRVKGAHRDPDDVAAADTNLAPDDWRRTFDVDRSKLGTVGNNPYFPLVPGWRIHLAGRDERVVITVLDEIKVVDGVETRVIEELETKGGELMEISRNYFAIDATSGDVYYFGEDVDIYEGGQVVGHGGAWLSGVNGAHFGLALPGRPTVGAKYYQEVSPGEAMDRAEVVALDATLRTPLKLFVDVLQCRETTALDPHEVSHKWYVAGVGMIGDDRLRIVELEKPSE